MDVITMLSIQSLIIRLLEDYPMIKFVSSNNFSWSKDNLTLNYVDNYLLWPMIIHEIAHYELKHSSYDNAIHLLQIERDAWTKANEIAIRYNLSIDENIIEDSLDSYREWLHTRSKCTNCEAIGIETNKNIYRCVQCDNMWKVNEARSCRIKRYKINQ